ncbi:MAG: STAS domain-containing protein [Leptospirales bacterium]|nr:STAS domain-containing protein [Leptospirales bacterium]
MNSFNLTCKIIKSFPIIFFDGQITSEIEELLDKAYHEVMSQVDSKLLILDFTKADYINSSGISSLIKILKINKESGGDLIFTGLSDHIKKVMDIVGLSDYVKIFNTTDIAINHYNN